MATTREYSELVTLVRNWANRDSQALPDGIIMDGIRYAVDTAYRTLRIPPLEHTVHGQILLPLLLPLVEKVIYQSNLVNVHRNLNLASRH